MHTDREIFISEGRLQQINPSTPRIVTYPFDKHLTLKSIIISWGFPTKPLYDIQSIFSFPLLISPF
jgi:hypothetical protein